MNFVNSINDLQSQKSSNTNVFTGQKTESSQTTWDPSNIFHCSADHKYAVVILNRPIRWKQELLLQIWKNAKIRVTVDGGTNRWITFLGQQGESVLSGKCKEYMPDIITGDFDSICPQILEKLKSNGAMVINTPDQNDTDYTKALMQLGAYSKNQNIQLDGVYVFADTSGRIDHIVANINTLYKSNHLLGNIKVINVASNSLTWLLQPGKHKIIIPNDLVEHSSWCSLLPFGTPVNCISTRGLKWDLENSTMEFGGLISSSNTYNGYPEVTVTTDTATIWTMGIEPLVKTVVDD
ncbi:thiamin pyrophosphokinase 1 isoform X2 [Cephus cinctus]|uniref:Thiamin pyrophosphokinase 1 isoform X2 n=1 Tax=Cephus cinctus TaxID=211228 RepID=A0AAJ7C6B1_CEPCN|nr:thiamin pyrophosphokinase 1 isoform X2 [Cephus cinctus]